MRGSYAPRSEPPPKPGFPSHPQTLLARLLSGTTPIRSPGFTGGTSQARSGQRRLPALGGRQLVVAALHVPATCLAPDPAWMDTGPQKGSPSQDPVLLEMSDTSSQVCCKDSAGTLCTKREGGHPEKGHTVATLAEPVSPSVGTDGPGASALGGVSRGRGHTARLSGS